MMCQMSVVKEKDEQIEVVMENASLLEVTDDGVVISSLFDPPVTVSGVQVAKIDFMNGKVFLENTNE
jgi:predicted RNA-binding protein